MIGRIFTAFLERQEKDAAVLTAESDLVAVTPVEPAPYRRYIVRYACTGLVRTPEGVAEANDFHLGVYFPLDYIRHVNAAECLTFLWPPNVFHPNVRFPFVCPGTLLPGTPLVEIVYRCAEIITYQKVTMREDNALDWNACAWARKNKERFPIDKRPLRRAAVRFRIKGAAPHPATDKRGEDS